MRMEMFVDEHKWKASEDTTWKRLLLTLVIRLEKAMHEDVLREWNIRRSTSFAQTTVQKVEL